ncbi:MAG: hypothetical protein P4L47_13085 [Mucilaginibacter sp.]|nr:hypothetical protein [Mucilaginibacter sp.]
MFLAFMGVFTNKKPLFPGYFAPIYPGGPRLGNQLCKQSYFSWMAGDLSARRRPVGLYWRKSACATGYAMGCTHRWCITSFQDLKLVYTSPERALYVNAGRSPADIGTPASPERALHLYAG